MNRHATISALIITLTTLLASCGNRGNPSQAEAVSQEAASTVNEPSRAGHMPPTETSAVRADQEPGVEDIDRWQRGMAAEKKLVQEAAAKLAAAAKNDSSAKLDAVNASLEMNTLDAGSAAAGIERETYRRIRSMFSDAVAQLSPLEMEMDVSKMPAQMVEQLRSGREQSAAQLSIQLPPDVFAALKARAAELRQQEKDLIGERLKVANSAR